MKAKWWNPRVSALSFCITVFLLHFILKLVLAKHDVVSCIFAAGAHLPLWMIMATITFVFVRVALFFVIPVVVVWKSVQFLSKRFL